MLKELVKERLMAAAEEILALFERTIASYEEELSRTREEKERHRQQLEAVSKTHTVLHIEDVQQLIDHQEEYPRQPQVRSSTLKQEDLQYTHVKEEEEELRITQDGVCVLEPEKADLTKLPLIGVSVKTEEHEDKPPESSQFHLSPSEEKRGVESPSSSLPQHMTTEADGDHCEGSQKDKLPTPLSDSENTMSHSPEEEEALSRETDCRGDMRTHTDNKHPENQKGNKCWVCSVCPKRFSYQSLLTQHMRTHTGEKPYSCSVCDNTFTQRSTMMRHMATHTGEKPFSCSVCGKRFSQNSHRLSHMTTHTGEKPYSCSICGDTFSVRSYLTRHMTTHTGEKPFSCSVCDKHFFRRSYLVLHMRTHTGEKPFSCSVCGKGFSRRSNMVDHMRRHRGEKAYQERLSSASDKNKKE